MPSLNKVFLMGHLTSDPEIRHTAAGMAIASFGLAINRKWKDKTTGEQREEVVFVDLDAWGKLADLAAKYTAKGLPILVEGRLKLDQWEDKETKQKRSKLKVVCDQLQFLAWKDQGAQTKPAQPAAAGGSGQAPEQAELPATGGDEDVPF